MQQITKMAIAAMILFSAADARAFSYVGTAPAGTAPSAASAEEDAHSYEPTEEMQQLVLRLLRDNVPREFASEKKWNRTKRMTVIRLRDERGRLRPGPREKDMRHGQWSKYKAQLINPDQELDVRIVHVRGGDQGPVKVRVVATGKINAVARVANWRRGVQLYSFAANADAKLRITLDMETQLVLDPSHLPPDVLIKAEATDAKIEVLDFELNSLSDLHGKLAEGLGELVQKYIEDEVEEKNEKLVRKINEAIEKKQDRLRLSLANLLNSAWSDLVRK